MYSKIIKKTHMRMKNTEFSILVGYEIGVRLIGLLKIIHEASIASVMN